MRPGLPRRLAAISACIALAAIAACAAAPDIDGGIVGTGNRIDCEATRSKEGPHAPAPEDCSGASRATR